MATVSDASDQVRVALGHPSQDEKGGSNAMAVEEEKKVIDVFLHTGREAFPSRPWDEVFTNVEPFLEVHRQVIVHRGGSPLECCTVARGLILPIMGSRWNCPTGP